MNVTKKKVSKEIFSFLVTCIASATYALGINLFLAPNQITPGGFAGLAIILNYLFKFPIGVILLALNVPLLLISIKRFGIKMIIKTLVSTVLMSLFIDFFANLNRFSDDLLIAAIYGGILCGTGLGLMLINGSTSGGSDILAFQIQRALKGVSIGKILLAIDVIVIGTSAIVFSNIEIALYAGISKIISAKVLDAFVSGFNYAKTAMIITEKPREISKAIIKILHHGVTKLEATGMYTGESKFVLMVVIKNHETHSLKQIIKRIDPKAFIILNNSSEVVGRGFKTEEYEKKNRRKYLPINN